MTAYRSLTDAQLAARHDPAPYAGYDGNRSAHPPVDVLFDFRPRVECIPSRDPWPWLIRGTFAGVAMVDRVQDTENVIDAEWAPRPEFARPPVNRVLVHFRRTVEANQVPTTARHTSAWLASLNSMYAAGLYESAEIDHARKVLSRIAAISGPASTIAPDGAAITEESA